MAHKPKIACLILNYRTAKMTLQAVEAARVALHNLSGEIVIIDNASNDGSVEEFKTYIAELNKPPNVHLIVSPVNGGYGAGNNIGFRHKFENGVPDYFYILNSDAFPASNAVEHLVTFLENTPKAAVAGSHIHGVDGSTHLTTFRFPSIASELEGSLHFGPISRLLKDYKVTVPTPKQNARVDWLAGASMLVRRCVLEEVGDFDERFFLYFEETDLCRRIAKAGYEIWCIPDSHVAHVGSASTGMKKWHRTPSYWFDSRLYYFMKNHGAIYAFAATFMHLVGGSLNWLRAKASGKPAPNGPYFLADMAKHFFRNFFKSNRICSALRRDSQIVGE